MPVSRKQHNAGKEQIARLRAAQERQAGFLPEERKAFAEAFEKGMIIRTKFLKLFNDPERMKRNVTQLKAPCTRPGCGGIIHARIHRKKFNQPPHIHFACSEAGCFRWME
jgi:hypothetical protein